MTDMTEQEAQEEAQKIIDAWASAYKTLFEQLAPMIDAFIDVARELGIFDYPKRTGKKSHNWKKRRAKVRSGKWGAR